MLSVFLFGICCGCTLWFLKKLVFNRYYNKRSTKNTMDFVLDYFVLHLDSEPSYRKFMDNMLCKNEQYEFAPVSSYEEFKKSFISVSGRRGEIPTRLRNDYHVPLVCVQQVLLGHGVADIAFFGRLWEGSKKWSFLPRKHDAYVEFTCH